MLKRFELGVVFVLALLTATSCNKDFNNALPTQYNNDSLAVSAGKKKVLYIILDGVRGSVLASMKPTTIMQINRSATYSFAALNDSTFFAPTNAGSWANMLTGVDANSHKVTSESFAGNNLTAFPTLFTRLKQAKAELKTIAYASSSAFDTNLAADASEHTLFASDAELKTKLVTDLTTTEASLLVAQFHGADVAGATGGYHENNMAYREAINTIDGYLKEVLDALSARPQYADESWLVVIASNKGGIDATASTADVSLYGNTEKNTYVAFFNPAFLAKGYNKPNTSEIPYAGSAPRFVSTANSSVIATLANKAVGNFGTNGNYVILFKMRSDGGTDNYWPAFMGKLSNSFSLTGDGWGMMFSGSSFQIDVANVTANRPNVSTLRDGKWHTVAVKISTENLMRTVTQYSDGVKRGTYNLSTSINLTNSQALRIGASAGKENNFLFRDFAIINTTMSDADIINHMAREVTVNSPFFGSLVGWWPMKEGQGLTLKDASGKGNDFTLTNNATWAAFSDLSPLIKPELSGIAYRQVPNGVDIPFQIYHWLGVLPQSDWGLTGKGWSPSYSSLTTN